jgi:hypothetical protein
MASEKFKNLMPIYIGFLIQIAGAILMLITKNFPLGLVSCTLGLFIMVWGASRKIGNTNVYKKYSYRKPKYYTGKYALKLFTIRCTFIMVPFLLLIGTMSLLFSAEIITSRSLLYIVGLKDTSASAEAVNEILRPGFSRYFNQLNSFLFFSGAAILIALNVWLKKRWKL